MDEDYAAQMASLIELMRIIGNDTQQCEVKECKRKLSSSITDTLSAFSNGSGGYIILGLSEKAGFTPVEGFNARSMQEALSQACEKMTPPVRPTIVTCPFEGTNLVFARVEEMLPRDKPCFITALGPHKGSFIRTGDGDRRMTDYEVDRLIEEHVQPSYDLETVPDATLDDLNPHLVLGLLRRQRELHPHVFAGRGDDDMLHDLRVLDREPEGTTFRPTIAGLLALGRYPQKYFPRLNVTIAVFPGNSRTEVFVEGERLIASETIVGPVPVMIDDTVESLRQWTGAGDDDRSLDGGGPADYSLTVLREVVTNALLHRDYSPDARGTQVHVDVFTDRIEVSNPGGLFGAVTRSTLTTPGTGSTRNQYLAALLASTPYPDGGYVLENGGAGYVQIEHTLNQEGSDPATIRNTIDEFRITVPRRRPPEDDRARNVAQHIVTLLKENPSASVRDIMHDLDLTPLAVANALKALIAKGLVESVPARPQPQRYYRLKR
ncbi:ATP-binding protein [Bifidobacterium simiarum]|uniref:Dihydroorotate dehydrogenase n=1 Tax=Bifidobacterium simiarum TaxID=2045441 RepID=A0A2M9HEF6_9BIFI|nr:ATP-binding protein [Bifidobacterium simiarum]PJM75167.1 dihydroorotate dehydrogenase [Bifidobacterium simiarum]